MRSTPLIPLACALIALTLSLLCVFAGSRSDYLEDAHILTPNTSRLGQLDFSQSKPSPTSPFSSLTSSITNGLEDVGNGIISDITDQLGIRDFYSAHLLTYCEGFYKPNERAPNASKNVTRCSNQTALYTFNPTEIIKSELKAGISLDDLQWPQAVGDGIRVLGAAFKAMFIAYMVGIVLTGLTLLASLFGIFNARTSTISINMVLSFLSFLALGIASGIVTAVSVRAVDVINRHGNAIGIMAARGSKFLDMTWSATILMLLATLAWMGDCVRSRKRITYRKDR